jgi:low temperature requirement protein LtrA
MAAEDTPTESAVRVSTLELFFDLVFVFVVTQLTDLIAHHFDGAGVFQVLLLFGITWWMYGGYAWLTNVMAPSSTTRRTLLLTGMAGFLVMALAIPDAFRHTGWLFGVGYFVVNLVHTTLFLRATGSARAALSLAPYNAASAILVLVGGFVPSPFREILWSVAFALQIVTPYLHRLGGHTVIAGHFVERHGLVVIIAIGESIVAIGAGFAGQPLDWSTVTVAILGLGIAYYLWWAYFAGDDERSEQVLEGITDPARRARVALNGWGYAHYPLVLGIVFVSAGVKTTVGHAFDPLDWAPAIALGGGAALFMLGHAWFLRILRLRGGPHRLAAAALCLATIPLAHVIAIAQLVAVPLAMAIPLIVEDIPLVRRSGGTAVHTFGR